MLAQQKLRELLIHSDRGIPIGTTKITFGEWLAKWMTDYVFPNTRQKTAERYEGLIKKHIAPHLGRIDLITITPSDIQELEAKLIANGMAPQGVQLVHNVISGAFKYSLRMEKAWRNSAKSVTPPKIVRKEVEPPEIGLGNSWTWKWSHVLSVVSCRIVLLASNHLTDNTSQHATTGMNIRAE